MEIAEPAPQSSLRSGQRLSAFEPPQQQSRLTSDPPEDEQSLRLLPDVMQTYDGFRSPSAPLDSSPSIGESRFKLTEVRTIRAPIAAGTKPDAQSWAAVATLECLCSGPLEASRPRTAAVNFEGSVILRWRSALHEVSVDEPQISSQLCPAPAHVQPVSR